MQCELGTAIDRQPNFHQRERVGAQNERAPQVVETPARLLIPALTEKGLKPISNRITSLPLPHPENFGCNNNKNLHYHGSHTTRTARVLVSLAATLLVLASAGFGCYFAWHVGSQHDIALGMLRRRRLVTRVANALKSRGTESD